MTDQANIMAALAKAQASLDAPGKNREVSVKLNGGGSYKFKYTTLDALIEHVRKPLTDNGLWFVQTTEPGTMVTRIVHESGESICSAIPMPNLPAKPQEAGSVLTYFRRYSLALALGLASDDDDDANVAEGNGYEAREPAKKKPPAKEPEPKEIPTGPITDTTRDWLQAQIDSTGETVGAFCKFFAIDSLKDVTYEDIGSARKWVASFKKETK